MLERSHLDIIAAIERYGTLTEAAERLHLTQSALSHAIRKLEERAGVAIWSRQGRKLEFTQAGQYLLSVARTVLPVLEQAEEMMAGFAAGKRGRLRIGMECHPCYQWLLQVVSPYLKKWPDVDLDVRQRFQFSGLQAIKHYEIDALITPDPIQDDLLEFRPVFNYQLELALHQDHPLTKKDYIEPEDLQHEVLISYPVPHERLDVYTNFLIPAEITPRQNPQVETTEIMVELVAAQRGVSAMPDWLIRRYAGQLPIVSRPLGPEGVQKSIYVGTRVRDREIDYLNGFIEDCRRIQQ
ncbi:LysR family transcriptional regulator [Hahella sp. CCB-MM4]|uniref:LysR family transcriptional regulator n=1 Tax=Hahella sp. (strain CCB-MM4) TaxID=1926491 RepID=UPI000B9AE89B|nr:LysR family transcriptional regulator [Hahella sp. CCB-MM4]OZG74449.1 LysR family transcriptional regulator [Hahella sp. CCB-MM4]